MEKAWNIQHQRGLFNMKFSKLFSLFCISVLATNLHATIYEDAEDGNTVGWRVYDKTPEGATITNLAVDGGHVISLQGAGRSNGYILGDFTGRDNAWNNRDEKSISWRMKFSEEYTIYIAVNTTKGARYLRYSARDTDLGNMGNGYIHHGLGSSSDDGTWQSFSRDLEADLIQYEPDNNLIAVNGFLIRGSGEVDDIALNYNREILAPKIYEDAEDGDTIGWSIYDKSPDGAMISNVLDSDTNSHVIALNGAGRQNGYMVGNWAGQAGAWAEMNRDTVSWDIKYSEDYSFYFTVQTTKGERYLYYSSASNDRGIIGDGLYIHHGLGESFKDGKWHTITRNLENDLKEFESDNHLIAVNGLLIRGSGKIDNIIFTDGAPILADTVYEDAEVAISNAWETIVGNTPPTRHTPGFNSEGFIKLQPHWEQLDNGNWINRAEYHLPMNNASQKILSVDIGGDGNNMPHYVLGVKTKTKKGIRTILWDSWYTHEGMSPKTIELADGSKRMIFPSPVEQVRGWGFADVNLWENFTINIENQLQILEPDNEIYVVETFIATGGNLDNLKLKSK